jgi:putative protein-disulfide isomerase
MEQKSQEHPLKQEEEQVEIIYYTDPLCCWSWAFEPHWKMLKAEFKGKISCRYRMGGLLPDWNSYHDPLNSVSRPSQMGPVWMEASRVSGVPIHDRIWMEDPPASSYPACIAVKCAELQSSEAAEEYLRCLREAVMLNGRNIARREILLELGEILSSASPHIFNFKKFKKDLHNDAGMNAFRDDLHKVRYHQIGRFPALTMRKPREAGIIIIGYRPYKILCDALTHIAPELFSIPGNNNFDILKNQRNQYN